MRSTNPNLSIFAALTFVIAVFGVPSSKNFSGIVNGAELRNPLLVRLRKFFRRRARGEKNKKKNDDIENMGQAMRMMKYDRAANERNAVGALNFVDHALHWYRLDDGVMGA